LEKEDSFTYYLGLVWVVCFLGRLQRGDTDPLSDLLGGRLGKVLIARQLVTRLGAAYKGTRLPEKVRVTI
jgi:hypothetical protein